ncbi:LysR family transcriptional regulator, partial [Pseudomonas aeruginosa]|nr:LysR family transcriptional regulator [Pseudomonas aeruginosa]
NEVRYLEIEPAGARSEIHAILPASEPSRAAQAFLATLKSGLDDA